MSFYADHAPLHAAGQALIAGFFLFQGVKNTLLFRVNAGRLAAKGVPLPSAALALGLGVQFVGAALVLADWQRAAGAWLLIGFTVVATWLFHRFWRAPEAERRLDLLLFTYNVLVVGALLTMT
jgi:putative oxidoreductase